MKRLLSTREVAQLLGVNEKMVYSLVADKGLPASKITGKWIFPAHLVEQWIETHTINYPQGDNHLSEYQGLLVLSGSNDILLDNTISLFNQTFPEHLAVFGNLGSMRGLRALKQNLCHIATSHLLQENGKEYNFEFAYGQLEKMPVVINFCRREQGLLVQKGNPKKIRTVRDLRKPGIVMVNRSLGTGTRLLLDRELKKADLPGDKISGYQHEVNRHMEVGLEVLSGRADAGPAIRSVAGLLDLDFIPLRWERYDFMIAKAHFFDKKVQVFLSLLHDASFDKMVERLDGYDTSLTGRMVFPAEPDAKGKNHVGKKDSIE